MSEFLPEGGGEGSHDSERREGTVLLPRGYERTAIKKHQENVVIIRTKSRHRGQSFSHCSDQWREENTSPTTIL